MCKRIIALLLAIVMIIGLAACGEKSQAADEPVIAPEETIKVGMVCIGDENSAYDRNFYQAADAATAILAEEGINVEWIYKYNFPDGDDVTTANEELAEQCVIVYNNSYGQEPYMLKAAEEFPEVQFVGMTNEAGAFDDLDNTHNAFVTIYEGRYLAGVVAGMKLNELMEEGTITEPKIGYVGAYSFAEVISGFTAYYLGAKSVCPEVTMDVSFVNSWSDATLEGQAASALYSRGCQVISQHSDNTTPATSAQENDIFHTGYNIGMSDVAPESSLISTYIDWTNYFVYTIEKVANGETFEQDWCGSLATGDVKMTALNTEIAADGTQEKLDEATAALIDGSIQVFDIDTFTVNGEKVTQAYAIDTDGDWVPDTEEAIFDNVFHESYFKSAPYFTLQIDGITWTN